MLLIVHDRTGIGHIISILISFVELIILWLWFAALRIGFTSKSAHVILLWIIFVASRFHSLLFWPKSSFRFVGFERHHLFVPMASIPTQCQTFCVAHDNAGAAAILSQCVWHHAVYYGEFRQGNDGLYDGNIETSCSQGHNRENLITDFRSSVGFTRHSCSYMAFNEFRVAFDERQKIKFTYRSNCCVNSNSNSFYWLDWCVLVRYTFCSYSVLLTKKAAHTAPALYHYALTLYRYCCGAHMPHS